MEFIIIKILHIVAMISWMAGLFYLPRLFVYHADKKVGSEIDETFKVMEYKLYKYIMIPAMIITIITGILMFNILDIIVSNIFMIKIFSVGILLIYHNYLGWTLKQFKNGTNIKSHKFFRIINEIPIILLVIIISVLILRSYSYY